MKIIKPQLLGLLWRTYRRNGNHMALTGLLCFPFSSPEHPITEQMMWQKITPELPESGVWDEGIPKDRGEVIFSARAFSSDGKPTAYRHISVQVGPISKSLSIHGDRHWERKTDGWRRSEAQPFIEMPIDFSRAFGGPGYPKNPKGKGFSIKEEENSTPLPNIESPFSPVESPYDRPDPETLGALDLSCPIRISKAGSYQTGEIGKGPPPLPANADWTLYNQALPDQWLPEFWKGGEKFALEGLSPLSRTQEGTLPLILLKSFITRIDNERESFVEVPMHPETVWLFPHLGIGVIVHRGSMPISTDDASEVKSILLAAEDPQDKRLAEHYLQIRNRRETRDPKDLSLYGDAPLLPVRLEKDPQTNAANVQYHLSTLANESTDRKKKMLLRKIDQAQEQEDRTPEDLLALSSTSKSEENPSANEKISNVRISRNLKIEELKSTLEKAPPKSPLEVFDGTLSKRPDMETIKDQIDNKIRGALARIPDDVLQKKKINREELLHAKPSQPPSRRELDDMFSIESFNERLRKGGESVSLTRAKNSGSLGKTSSNSAPMVSASGISQDKLDAMKKMPEQVVRTVHFYAPPPPDQDQARKKRAMVVERLGTSRDFRRWDLRGADLSGLDLLKCDFSGADLIGCNLSGSNISDTSFRQTWATHANFSRGNLDRADFSGANLGCSNLSFSTGTQITFHETILTGALMDDCALSESHFEKTDLSNISFTRSTFQNCYFSHPRFMSIKGMPASPEARLHPEGDTDRLFFDEVSFFGSTFEKALFIKIDFRRVCFSKSFLSQATFLDCNGPESRFSQATLHKTAFPQCMDFSCSNFRGADLTGANLRGVNLSESNFCESTLNALDGSEGNWQRAKISGSRAIAVRFQKTDLSYIDARGTDFRQTIFVKANLLFADFSHASLYKASFTGAHIDDSTRWDHALTGKTTLERQGS